MCLSHDVSVPRCVLKATRDAHVPERVAGGTAEQPGLRGVLACNNAAESHAHRKHNTLVNHRANCQPLRGGISMARLLALDAAIAKYATASFDDSTPLLE